jgi:putative phosphoribosyl transferase
MVTTAEYQLQSRSDAALIFAGKLAEYTRTGAIVVAVPNGGTPIGYRLSTLLGLPLELALCKKVQHPGLCHVTIGSVSIDDVVMNDKLRNIPQDFIQHQIILLQNTLKSKYRDYSKGRRPISLQDKVIIVTDDFLITGDTLLACLKSIRKQKPEKIIVAVAFATPVGIHQVEQFVDEIHVIKTVYDHSALEELYRELPRVKDDEVRDLFSKAISRKSY